MDRGPLVSIVLPTYNRLEFLREAVASVLAQTLSDWELIVLDDGSTDETGSYLRSLADQRIRVVECAHRGRPAKLRNVGLAQASGRYVAFLDSDDTWAPTKLELQVADLARKPSARWGYCNARYVGLDAVPIPPPPGRIRLQCEGWIFEQIVQGAAWVATPTVIAERALLAEAGGFDETLRFAEDHDLWLRLAILSPVSHVAAPLATVVRHPGCTWRAQPIVAAEDSLRVFERRVADPTLRRSRRICRRQVARASVSLAEWLCGERRYGEAVRALIRGLPTALALPPWWVSLVKTCLRPFTPAPVLRLYRRANAWRHGTAGG